jgi:DNA-binding NarL/FixJ family response regulator
MGVREMIATYRPAVVLVDVNIPLLKGDELVSLARTAATAAGLSPRFILYSALDDEDLAARTKNSGADGWISKNHPIERLGDKLRSLI